MFSEISHLKKSVTMAWLIAIALGACCGIAQGKDYYCDGLLCYKSTGHKKPQAFRCHEKSFECCKGPGFNEWTIKNSTSGFKCCTGSGELYNQETDVCVNGTFRPKSVATELECGLTATYDVEREDCCRRDQVFGRVYKKGGVCCNETYLTNPNQDCCEGIKYRKSEQTCCRSDTGHRLFDIPNGSCCLDQAFDPQLQTCDDEVGLVNKTTKRSVCHEKNYDSQTHLCCGKHIRNMTEYLCYLGRTPVRKIASNSQDNEACLLQNNTMVTFRNTPQNRQVCIHRRRIVNLSYNQGVCRSVVYNIETDLCCGGMFYANAARNGRKCCKHRTKHYNPATETCCYNKISDRISENDGGRCCRREAYDPRVESCSSGKVVPVECPSETGMPYVERCKLTEDQIRQVKVSFHEGGLSVYVATVIRKMVTKGKFRKWQVKEVEQLSSLDEKRQRKFPERVKLTNLSGNAIIKARTCSCPCQMVPGERYIIFSAKSMKRGKPLSLKVKEQFALNMTDAVIPLENVNKLGNWFQILFGYLND